MRIGFIPAPGVSQPVQPIQLVISQHQVFISNIGRLILQSSKSWPLLQHLRSVRKHFYYYKDTDQTTREEVPSILFQKEITIHSSLTLTLQSLEGTVLVEFRWVKLSMQDPYFFLIKAPSSQLHSEYGKPIHLHRYSGSLEDAVLWLWAVSLFKHRQIVK